jgi:hypothetical protein
MDRRRFNPLELGVDDGQDILRMEKIIGLLLYQYIRDVLLIPFSLPPVKGSPPLCGNSVAMEKIRCKAFCLTH